MLVWLIEIYSLPLDLLTKLCYNEFCRAQYGRISSPSNLLLQSTSSPVYSPHKRGHSGPSIQLRLESQPMQAPISPACSLRSELNCTEWHSFMRRSLFRVTHHLQLQFCDRRMISQYTQHWSACSGRAKWPTAPACRFCSTGSWTGFWTGKRCEALSAVHVTSCVE